MISHRSDKQILMDINPWSNASNSRCQNKSVITHFIGNLYNVMGESNTITYVQNVSEQSHAFILTISIQQHYFFQITKCVIMSIN